MHHDAGSGVPVLLLHVANLLRWRFGYGYDSVLQLRCLCAWVAKARSSQRLVVSVYARVFWFWFARSLLCSNCCEPGPSSVELPTQATSEEHVLTRRGSVLKTV